MFSTAFWDLANSRPVQPLMSSSHLFFSVGKEDKADRRRGGKTTSGLWTGLEFAKSQRAMENREKWRKLVAKSSVLPQ